MQIKQLSIFVENKSGRLAEITALISGNGINIRALSIADTSDFGILRLIVDQPELAVTVLKAAGLAVTLTMVIAVSIPDEPGAFARAIAALSGAGVEIEYMYAFISRSEGNAFVILRLQNNEKGIVTLRESGFTILDSEKIYHM